MKVDKLGNLEEILANMCAKVWQNVVLQASTPKKKQQPEMMLNATPWMFVKDMIF